MDTDKLHLHRIRIFKGELAEKYVELVLRDKGYHVSKIAEKNKSKSKFYFHTLKIASFLKIARVKNASYVLNKLRENYNKKLPDFICRKKKEIRFIEVKSNSSGIDEEQKKSFEMIRSMGFKVDIVRVNLNLDMNLMNREEMIKIEQEHKENGRPCDFECLDINEL